MPGLRILIPSTGPGSGPIIPGPLHAYGRTDATHRYVASRLSGTVGSLVSSWPDLIGSAHWTLPVGEVQTLTIASETGGFRSVAQPNAALTGTSRQHMKRTADLTTKTIICVARFPSASVAATRNLFQSANRWRSFVGGNNGQPGVAFTTGSGGSGIAAGQSGFFNSTTPNAFSVSVDSTTGAAMLKAPSIAAVTTTLTLSSTKITEDELFSTDVVALDARIYEIIEFPTVLTSSEQETVLQALKSHYGF